LTIRAVEPGAQGGAAEGDIVIQRLRRLSQHIGRAVARVDIARLRSRRAISALAVCAVVFVLGVGFGNWASDNELRRIAADAVGDAGALRPMRDWIRGQSARRQTVAWRVLDGSSLHSLEAAEIVLTPFETFGAGGAIEEVAGRIVFATPTGELAYLGRRNMLRPLATDVPMNLEGLQRHAFARDPRFSMSSFRVLDLLAVERTTGRHDLYVSHHRFAGDCFEFVVSVIGLTADVEGLHVAPGGWSEVFVAEPCMPPKDEDLLWGGMESGGRMVLRGDTMLVSIGDHQFDGVRYPRAMAQEPTTHLGKIVEIDLDSGDARIFASGLRNPQGLLVARDGTIWETEHGPQGGDEINLIRDGGNYGWPYVTYGREYGWRPRVDWPLNPTQGRHDGYDKPAFAFVPSIAISNLVEPDLRAFPLWRSHLLVVSLGGYQYDNDSGSLFLVRLKDGVTPVYVEPIPIGHRLRDIIVLDDGRLAILTDSGRLILVRNEEPTPGSDDLDQFVVELSSEVDEAERMSIAASSAEHGQLLFGEHCARCHGLAGTGIGPPLAGVLGRRIGSAEGYVYSPALGEREDTWTQRKLLSFLTDSDRDFAGSSMPATNVSRRDASAIIDFLRAETARSSAAAE
jgi:cytochrome c2